MTPGVIVVTGATGFTGPFVVKALRGRFPDATLRCFVRPASRLDALRALPVEFATGDLRNADSMRTALRGADTFVHVASLGFDWLEPLFAAIAASSLLRGVFISTTAILTKLPVRSKAIREQGEALVRASGLRWTILRPTMIYGTPADRNVARLIRFAQRWPVIPIIAPGARQQPVHVEDVATAVAAALASPATIARTYNLAGREPMTLEDMVRAVTRAAGVRRLIVPLPSAPVRAAVSLYARLSAHPPVSVEQVDRLHEDKSFDYADAARDFQFAPRSFACGVRAEVAMMQATR